MDKVKSALSKTQSQPSCSASPNETIANALSKMHYELVGNHGAVQVCMWTKESLLGKGVCYKEKFYGIKSHRCVQMSPCVDVCDQRCVFCWRPWELMKEKKITDWDDPAKLIDGCAAAFRKKLTGFGGNDKVNKKKLAEAQTPFSFAISLSGEPTMYPYLSDLIKELRKRKIISFLVTNGQHPEVLEKLAYEDALPTQLYVSLDAPNEKLYKKINQPLSKKGWSNLKKTLSMLHDLKCKRVIRLTVIKGVNDSGISQYAKLIRKSNADFIEVKAYMHLGFSRQRLKQSNMPVYAEVLEFAEKLAKATCYKIVDRQERSRVVLLRRI